MSKHIAKELAEELFSEIDVDRKAALSIAELGLTKFLDWFMAPERMAIRAARRKRRKQLRLERRAIRKKS